MFADAYYQFVISLIPLIEKEERDNISRAGAILADTLEKDGLLYVFGCGHSHMIEEELFYRAGGLMAVSPIFETSAMLHEGAIKSSQVERMTGYAPHVMDRYPMTENDLLLVISTSGINPFPIEVADAAHKKGAKVIVISSKAYLSRKARTSDGRHLPDAGDLVIDNHVPAGDAVVPVLQDGTKVGPVSSIASIFIANSIVLAACDSLRERGCEPEVFLSGNTPNGDAYNAQRVLRFKERIRHL